MKILIINCVYKEGSTGKIVSDCADYYRSRRHEVIIAFGDGPLNINDFQARRIRTKLEARIHVRLARMGLVMMFAGLPLATYKLKQLIKKERSFTQGETAVNNSLSRLKTPKEFFIFCQLL